MTIQRMYVDRPDDWQEVPEEEFLRRTEWAGYWKKGTALQVLRDCAKSGATFRTPWAFYRIAPPAKDYSGRRSGLGDGPISAEGPA